MSNSLFEHTNIKPKIQQKILKDAEFYKGIGIVVDDFYVEGSSFEEDDEHQDALESVSDQEHTLLDIRFIKQVFEYIDVYWNIRVDKYPDWDIFILGHSYLVCAETGELESLYHNWLSLRQARTRAVKIERATHQAIS